MKKEIMFTLLLFCFFVEVKAQQGAMPAGNDATGSGGTASYSIGQVFYTADTSSSGDVVQSGVQQQYEITSVVSSIPIDSLGWEVYPNPVINSLTLVVNSTKIPSSYKVTLLSSDGKILETNDIVSLNNTYDMSNRSRGVYYRFCRINNAKSKKT